MRKYKKSLLRSFSSAAIALSLFGCGQQTYDVLQTQANTDAPGGQDVPARADILMVLDNTGSMLGKEGFVAQQIRDQFLSKLDARNWDYRFAVIPTTPPSGTVPGIYQIAGSKYSTNHSSATEPYPFAFAAQTPDNTVDSAYFVESQNFNHFPAASTGGAEPAIKTLGDVMNNSTWKSKFFRSSADTIIIVVSNGDDTSETATNVYPYLPPSTVSATLINRIKSVKPNARLHSVVNTHGTPCLGGTFQPNRYRNASAQLVGSAFPLCDASGNFYSGFASVMSNLGATLQPTRLNYTQEFVVLPTRPTLGTLTVRKATNGALINLAQSTTNGWSYVDDDQAIYACEITSPIVDRCKTGYVIRLNGTAKAIGSEQIFFQYQEWGTNASIAN